MVNVDFLLLSFKEPACHDMNDTVNQQRNDYLPSWF
jgi:hypothetical protein